MPYNNSDIVQSLKNLVEFLGENPEFKISPPDLYSWVDDKADFIRHCKMLKTFEKDWSGGVAFKAIRNFGNEVEIRVLVDREEICERIETKTIIAAHTIPATEAMDVPEREKVTVEWKCPEDLSVMAERESREKERV